MVQQTTLTLKDVGSSAWNFTKTAGTYGFQKLQALGEWTINHKMDMLGIALIIIAIAIVCFSLYGGITLLTLPTIAGVGELGMVGIELSTLFLGMPLGMGIGIVVAALGVSLMGEAEKKRKLLEKA